MRWFVLVAITASLTTPIASFSPSLANHDGEYHGLTFRDSQGRIRCHKNNGRLGISAGGADKVSVGQINGEENRAPVTAVGAASGDLASREVVRSKRRCR